MNQQELKKHITVSLGLLQKEVNNSVNYLLILKELYQALLNAKEEKENPLY